MSILFLTAAGAANPDVAAQFGLIPALNEGGPISWSIFIVMVIMSVFSFYIMFTKLFEQQKVMNQYKEVRAQFWRAATLEEGAAKLDKNSAYRQVVDDGIAAQKQHSLLTDPIEAHDWLHGAMARSEDSINNKLASGLPFLATVGATAPFVGLLGTVIDFVLVHHATLVYPAAGAGWVGLAEHDAIGRDVFDVVDFVFTEGTIVDHDITQRAFEKRIVPRRSPQPKFTRGLQGCD